MKKTLIIIGSIGVFFYFITNILPNLIGVPLAAYNSYQTWNEHEKKLYETSNDSIQKFPFPLGSVSDYEKIFTVEQVKELTDFITDYEQKTTREIAVVSINSIEPYDDISEYATDLSNDWGVGKTKKDNGLVIVMSKSLREIKIVTGFGTEKILTDEICSTVLNETIIPELKKDNYYKGIENGLTELTQYWE